MRLSPTLRRWALLAVLLLVVALSVGRAVAATALGGTSPWAIDRVALGSTTDWDVYTAPGWAAQVLIRNAHSSGTLYVGRYDEIGTFAGASDEYITLPAGATLTLPLTLANGRGDDTHRAIPLASSTSSLPVELVYVETAQ